MGTKTKVALVVVGAVVIVGGGLLLLKRRGGGRFTDWETQEGADHVPPPARDPKPPDRRPGAGPHDNRTVDGDYRGPVRS